MRSTKMFFTLSSITILHLGFLLPLLLFDSTSATKQCKSTVMNIIMKQCSGARFRRDIEGVPPAAEQNKEDAAPTEKEQHILGQQDKRQISSDLVSAMAEYAAPILSEALKNYASENAAPNLRRSNSAMVPRYGTSYNSPYVDRMSGYYNGYSSSPRLLSYGGEGGGGGFIPQAAVGDLGLELSNEEMEELYSEINQRLPRAARSKEEARKIFMATAAKCCQNIELCMKDAKLISCI